MNVLIVLYSINDYSGTVIHAFELSKFLKSKGYEVYVTSYTNNKNICRIFTDIGIDVFNSKKIDTKKKYDYVYCMCHWVLGKLLLRGLNCRKLIISSHSKKGKQEEFPKYYEYVSTLLAVSNEVKENRILENNIKKEVYVFNNFLPNEYIVEKRCVSEKIYKIAVVSNHVPKELKDICKYLSEVKVDFYGVENDKYCLITPEILLQYDVIISIGKTIQYALGLKIPAYIYDKYGGNGYISNIKILEKEIEHNFTGRPNCRKLTSEQIAEEILRGYKECVKSLNEIQKVAIDKFLLSKYIDKMIVLFEESNDFDRNKLMNTRGIKYILIEESLNCFFEYVKRPLRNTKLYPILKK